MLYLGHQKFFILYGESLATDFDAKLIRGKIQSIKSFLIFPLYKKSKGKGRKYQDVIIMAFKELLPSLAGMSSVLNDNKIYPSIAISKQKIK